MSQITINNELLPQRCEICHQSDQFNQSLNICHRCNNISITSPKIDNKELKPNKNNFHWDKLFLLFGSIVLIFLLLYVIGFFLMLREIH
jgi:hypothetical protein